MSRRTFVLDTNVLLYDPKALEGFENCDLIVPLAVIEELDNMKRLPNDLGRNARLVMRAFDKIKKRYNQLDLVANGSVIMSEERAYSNHSSDLVSGVHLENGSTLKIYSKYKNDLHTELNFDKALAKNQILQAAHMLSKEHPSLTLLSKDFAVRLKAQMIGLNAQD